MKFPSFIIGSVLVGSFSVQAIAADQCPESAHKFWTSFRQSVLQGEKKKVAAYAQFPFEILGTLDSSEKRKVNREGFLASFHRLITTDPGLSQQPTTMLLFIKSTPKLGAASCSQSGNEFRVGDWEFELTPQGWRFVRAYLED